MSDIDFQNGFLCGMATRGLVTNGFVYSRYVEVIASDGINTTVLSRSIKGMLSDSVSFSSEANNSGIVDSINVTSIVQSIISGFSDSMSTNI